jgi:hypothetical protein
MRHADTSIAHDGVSFYSQPKATFDLFQDTYGPVEAHKEWVREHNAAIGYADPSVLDDPGYSWSGIVFAGSALILFVMWIRWRSIPAAERNRLTQARRDAEATRRAHAQELAKRKAAERNRPAFSACPRCRSTWINAPASFGQSFKQGLLIGAIAELTGTGVIVDNRDAGVWTCDNCRYRWVQR